MKRKIMVALTVVFAMSLAATIYAFNQSSAISSTTKANCCAKKDSCPMKKSENSEAKASCCDKADCCCKGDSCPMKSNGEAMNGENCGNCCGGSCPMKKDKTEATSPDAETVASHCKHKKM